MSKNDRHPNVLLIMDDQHRFDFLGYAGAEFVRSPNIDRLARRGMTFSRCTVSSTNCAPARIALASGLLPGRTGLLESNSYLPQRLPTMYRHFRDHGYRVGLVGKADLAKADRYNGLSGDRPCTFMWGFTHPFECEGKMHAARAVHGPLGPYTAYLQQQGLLESFIADYDKRREHGGIVDACEDSPLSREHVEDSFIGRHAAQWLDRVDDDFPWFLFVSFVGPHDPFDPPSDYAEHFAGVDVPAPIGSAACGSPGWIRNRRVDATLEQVARARRQYCALIELIDDQVGVLLETLERRGMADNTIVAFTSDHGEMLGDHALFRKSVLYEPAMRVPLLVSGPSIKADTNSNALVESIDLNPTLVELAGLPAQPHLDAMSFAGVLSGQDDAHREASVSFLPNCRAVRTDRYKYIENYNDIDELYDLESDAGETTNIAESDPATARRLRRLIRQRLREGGWQR